MRTRLQNADWFLFFFSPWGDKFDFLGSYVQNQSISICSNIYYRLFFMKQRLHGVVTSVNAVQSGKDADMENQSFTL